MGGQGQYTEGQGQSISGPGLYFGWAGAVMLRNHKYGQFRGIRNFAFHSDIQTDQGTHPLIESLSQRLKIGVHAC